MGIRLGERAASFQIKTMVTQVEFLNATIAKVEAEVAALLARVEPNITTIPGVSTATGAQIAAEPENTALYVERGKLHYRMGEWGPALNDFNAALRIDAEHVEAKEFARMVQEILEFRYKDIYNP